MPTASINGLSWVLNSQLGGVAVAAPKHVLDGDIEFCGEKMVYNI